MELHQGLIVIGALMLAGLLADTLGRRTRIPRVTLLIVFGIAIGAPGLDLIPYGVGEYHEFLATAALSMVAFVLGGSLTAGTLRAHGREIVLVSLGVVVVSTALVVLGLAAAGVPLPLALVLGGIATATDPAATRDVIRQFGVSNAFTERLMGIVAIDDAWGLIAFGLMLVGASALTGDATEGLVEMIAFDLGGALAIGLIVGLPAAYLTGRLRPGEPTQIEALGVVFVCAGLAVWLEVSFLLAGMVAGALVANLARHHERPFHEIENIQTPFLVLFFVLAGASLEVPALGALLPLCVGYVALRTMGRPAGAALGGAMAGLPVRESLWTGTALTPQAGVALGMALVAAERLPAYGETLLAVAVATTVLFEVLGPFATAAAIARHDRDLAPPGAS